MSFDKDEQRISDALDALDLEIATPDLMLGIQKKVDDSPTNSKRTRKSLRTMIALAAVVAVLGITAAAISLGSFHWLLERVNPPFGDVVESIEQTVESQGIKVTAVAAKSYRDMAVLYLTLQDTEGLGRVTEDTELGFSLNSNMQTLSYDLLYYDSKAGIAAYQIRLGAPDTFDSRSISLQIQALGYGEIDLGEMRMDLDFPQAVSKGEHNGKPYSSSTQAPSEKLTAGRLANIPGTKSAWVSAIGVNHGYLTVQFAQPARTSNISLYDIQPYLLDSNRNRVEPKPFAAGFSTNEQLQRPQDGQQGVYDFMEYYFAVNTDKLHGYTLCFEGSAWNVVKGDWNLNLNFDSVPEVREVTTDLTLDKVQMSDVVLTIHPLGMTLTGNGAQDLDYGAPIMVSTILETTKGDIELTSGFASRPNPEGPYEVVWHAPSTIDMNSVIAVRIGNNRIELK